MANFGLPRLLLLLIKTLKMKQKTSATLLKTANATKTIWHKKSIEIKCPLKLTRARERKHLIAEIMIIIKLISNFESSAKQIYIMGTISSNKVGQ